MTAPEIIHDGDPHYDHVQIPCPAATTIKRGHFVNNNSNALELYNAVGENVIFAGVALQTHDPSHEYPAGKDLTITEKCIVEVDVSSANYVRGQGLKNSGTTEGDSLILADHGGTPGDTIAWAFEKKTSATRIKVLVDVKLLQQVAGALWETPVV